MMSSENNIPLVPDISYIDTKIEGKLSKEEECNYYRQRFNSLKIVLEDFQNQLTVYKNRCLGVDTFAMALKESKQENVKLSKHVKALETAISILQKRLDHNGLSNSVNIQETELFVPGASKQTFVNLAKETARLRTLLKKENGLIGKKSANEIEDMKGALEETESENNQMKNKIKDMEANKLKMVSEYEAVIEKLTKEKQEETRKLAQELKGKEARQLKEKERRKSETASTDSCDVQALKDLLSKTVEKCSELHDKLPMAVTSSHSNSDNGSADERTRRPSVSQGDFEKLEAKHQEAVAMNLRWQTFSKERENQIKSLNDQIREMSDQMNAIIEERTKQNLAQLTVELNRKDAELLELRKQITGLSKDLTDATKRQSQMQHDSSTVEILKQQIQVCTEDFNTERKDREQAVQKAKALQDENTRLKNENAGIKRQFEQLKKDNERKQHRPPSYEKSMSSSSYGSESSPPPQYTSQYSQGSSVRYSYSQVPIQETPAQSVDQVVAMPFNDYTGSSIANSSSHAQETVYRSQVPYSDMRNYGSLPRPVAASNVTRSRSSTPPVGNNMMSVGSYVSMPRPPVPPVVSVSCIPPLANTSIPPLVRRGGSVKEELPCPKCNNKFSDDLLLSHIEDCTQ